jgi:predicted RNA-binding protein with PUA-like domain
MAYWLFKEEPDHYSFADLQRDGSAVWDGVENPLALKHLGQVRKKDQILYYHTGKEKAIVGVMEATSDAYPAPDAGDPRQVVVTVKPLFQLPRPVSLAEIKAAPFFAGWELVRMPRLSVMPVSADQWKRIEQMSKARRERPV